MAKAKNRDASDSVTGERGKLLREETRKGANRLPEMERMWGAPLSDQLRYWIANWDEFCAIVEKWDPVRIYLVVDRMRSATTLARCNLIRSGESQGGDLWEFGTHLDQLLTPVSGAPSTLNGAGLITDWRDDLRKHVGECLAMPSALVTTGKRAEAEVRRVLDQAHLEPRLRARVDSLLARLAVTVMKNGGVLMKQKAHLLHTGRDRTPSDSLEKLMTPRGQWTKARFGTVDGDYLRISAAGRRQAERLAELDVRPLGS